VADDGQRFCPYCGQSFLSGEAVLQCSGCGVMHHPACWVRNGGCSTTRPHDQGIVAGSYGEATSAPAGAAAGGQESVPPQWARPGAAQPERPPEPAETLPPVAAASAAAFGAPIGDGDEDEDVEADEPPARQPAREWAPPARQEGRYTPSQGLTDEYDAEAVVDEAEGEDYEDEWDDADEDDDEYYEDDELERRYSEAAGPAAAAGATARRAPAPSGARYVPPGPDRLPSNRPIARSRRDGGGGRYFLIPVMVAVLGIIGVGVVLLYNALSDDDDNVLPIATETPDGQDDETPTEEPDETPTEDGETPVTTPTATEGAATPTPTTEPQPGVFTPGQTVVVTGANCLNVRSTPDASGTDNILVCAPDGSTMTIIAQGDLIDGTQWWEVEYDGTQGFSAGEFLAAAE
jgi:hypothetical protein